MQKLYKSTRGSRVRLNLCEAILKGLADDGGLFVPDFPLTHYEFEQLNQLSVLPYHELAAKIIGEFGDDDMREGIADACLKAYKTQSHFPEEVVPIRQVGDIHVAELFHGATCAFKDIALSLLPHLMTFSLRYTGEEREVMILTATSGDTGKAALEGFSDVPGTRITVFYPDQGVSAVQKQQMVTTTGNNVDVVAIRGNFDDAQRAVKEAFADQTLQQTADTSGVFLSSANSINIGRLLPQIVYYFYSYFNIVRAGGLNLGDEVNFCIPSGNFGNCLAGVIARSMGLPVHRFIVASNTNNVLTDFFQNGTYDARREFHTTIAPAMDILVSSNVERLLSMYGDTNATAERMKQLADEGHYSISAAEGDLFHSIFFAGFQSRRQIDECIEQGFCKDHYVLDPHTAVGYGVLKDYQRTSGDTTPSILLSTASPFKFALDVLASISTLNVEEKDAILLLHRKTNAEVPAPLVDIFERPVLHSTVIERNEIIPYIKEKI